MNIKDWISKMPKVAASISMGVEMNHLGSFMEGEKMYQ